MTRTYHLFFGSVLFALAFSAQAQPSLPVSQRVSTGETNIANSPPLPPLPQSPVLYFRKLLAMSAAERVQSLADRSPEIRARILAKVHEYQALDPNERELRLRATDLRWYLTPLFHLAPADRAARLDQIPTELRDLVKSRLAEWDSLPASLQQELLDSDKTLHYFARINTTNSPSLDAKHQKITDQFNRFFDLTPAEQSQSLATLSDAERAQMGKTLQAFQNLPPQQRLACVRNYARFAGMSAVERADFLKNAERWSQMSPKERQAWRDLVAQVPVWPPMPSVVPANLIPPHHNVKPAGPSMATNAE